MKNEIKIQNEIPKAQKFIKEIPEVQKFIKEVPSVQKHIDEFVLNEFKNWKLLYL